MSQYFNTKKILELTLLLAFITTIIIASFHIAHFVGAHDGAKEIVARFGYAGVFIVSLVSGLNVFFPVPPATFVPIFTAAGLTLPIIIVALVLGTLVADLVGYVIGLWSKNFIADHYPRIHNFFISLNLHHHKLLVPVIFLYAGLSPLPNEALVIPLAVIGTPVHVFIVPLILGTALYHTITVFGVQNLFAFFF